MHLVGDTRLVAVLKTKKHIIIAHTIQQRSRRERRKREEEVDVGRFVYDEYGECDEYDEYDESDEYDDDDDDLLF